MAFNLIPVTRTPSPRAHVDVILNTTKHGDLSVTLSPTFLAGQEKLTVGCKVLIGYDPETKHLLITPAGEATESVRTIRPRAAFAGAGTVVVTAANLPEGIPLPTKRSPVEWKQDNGGVALNLSAF